MHNRIQRGETIRTVLFSELRQTKHRKYKAFPEARYEVMIDDAEDIGQSKRFVRRRDERLG